MAHSMFRAVDPDRCRSRVGRGWRRARSRRSRRSSLAPPRASAPGGPSPSSATADAGEILDTAEATRRARRRRRPDAEPAADATVALHELAAAVPGARRRRAPRARAALLARPTDGADDPLRRRLSGRRAGSRAPRARTSASSGSTTPGFDDAPDLTDANGVADGDGIPDYVEALLAIAEYSYAIEVAPGPLGWKPPKPDKEGCGADPGAHADIYLKQLGKQGLFGYETRRPGPGPRSAASTATWCSTTTTRRPSTATTTRASRRASPSRTSSTTCCSQNYDSFQDVVDVRVDRDLGRGEGLPGGQRLPRLRAAPSRSYPGEPITELFPPHDEGAEDLRRRDLEPLARHRWRRLRRRRDPARLGGLRRDRARPTSRSPPTTRRSATPVARASAASSAASPPRPPSGAPGSAASRRGPLPGRASARARCGQGKSASFKLDHTAYQPASTSAPRAAT